MVVGGVVIMNIMLAVVSERTHEIGIRKSVGARRQDILNQFLVESSMLAGMGGLIGVVLAWMSPPRCASFTAGAHGCADLRGGDWRRLFHRCRPVLRNLSGATGFQTRSDRGSEGGTMTENHDQPLPLVTAQFRRSRKITASEPRPEGASIGESNDSG